MAGLEEKRKEGNFALSVWLSVLFKSQATDRILSFVSSSFFPPVEEFVDFFVDMQRE